MRGAVLRKGPSRVGTKNETKSFGGELVHQRIQVEIWNGSWEIKNEISTNKSNPTNTTYRLCWEPRIGQALTHKFNSFTAGEQAEGSPY